MRKAGNVVRCTNCEGQIIVPEPAAEAAPVMARGGDKQPARAELLGPKLFERSDIDELLRPLAAPAYQQAFLHELLHGLPDDDGADLEFAGQRSATSEAGFCALDG